MTFVRPLHSSLVTIPNGPQCGVNDGVNRNPFNFLVNTLAALVAYIYQEKKPALDLEVKGLTAEPSAIF